MSCVDLDDESLEWRSAGTPPLMCGSIIATLFKQSCCIISDSPHFSQPRFRTIFSSSQETPRASRACASGPHSQSQPQQQEHVKAPFTHPHDTLFAGRDRLQASHGICRSQQPWLLGAHYLIVDAQKRAGLACLCGTVPSSCASPSGEGGP